jgi:hypothetical protein
MSLQGESNPLTAHGRRTATTTRPRILKENRKAGPRLPRCQAPVPCVESGVRAGCVCTVQRLYLMGTDSLCWL